MTENKRPQQDQQPNQDTEFAREPLEVNQPNDTEFATEIGGDVPNKPMEQKAKVSHETKDKRGGNHNPTGANQYTTGRNDDRGRKS